MNLHLHIGPGNHERILLDQLSVRQISHSYSNHFPNYIFRKDNQTHGSRYYDWYRRLSWGIGNRLGVRKNNLIDFTYPIYDKVTANRLDKNLLLFGWAQVSLECFKRNKGYGINVLDYPIPHPSTWQQLLLDEKEITGIVPHSLFSSKMIARMRHEIELADFISIPSEFVRESFLSNGVPESKLIFNPYGISTHLFKGSEKKVLSNKLKVSFVGSLELRKGVHYLLEAFKKLNPEHFELTLIGGIQNDFKKIYTKYSNLHHVTFTGAISKSDVATAIRNSDVMVMPSILEGLSLTILEAMASQLPVISTTNAGGLGIINDFDEGFLIDIREPSQIIEKLNWCYTNRDQLKVMGEKARNKAITYYDADCYGDRFVEKVYNLAL